MAKPTQDAWPPAQLAMLQNGDGQPVYFRPREATETLDEFVDRIATTVVKGVVNYPYTAFCEVVDGATGMTDQALSVLVLESMARQRAERSVQQP